MITSLVAVPVVVALLSACSPKSEVRVATIIDRGSGPLLCDEVLDSYPPSCVDGTPVVEWEWNDLPHEEQDGVRWGSYSLTITPDGDQVRAQLTATMVDDDS